MSLYKRCAVFAVVGVLGFVSPNVFAAPLPPSSVVNAQTSMDSQGNIQFLFDEGAGNKSSVKVAPVSNVAAGTVCPAVSVGALRYNTNLANIEYCDGVKWKLFGILKDTVTTCNAGTEGMTRYNTTKKALEFCNGTAWVSLGAQMTVTTTDYNSPKVSGHNVDTLIAGAGGTFTNDGFVGGAIRCNGGSNRLRVNLKINGVFVGSMTGQDVPNVFNHGGEWLTTYEVDHSSLFSAVPRGQPWQFYVDGNVGATNVDNIANCTLRVTRIGS